MRSCYHLIEAQRTSFPIQFMCRMLGVSRSGYYDWRDRPPSGRSRQDATLTGKIREIHLRSRETYGSLRVHAEVRDLGIRCGRRRVERLMRQAELRGCLRGSRRGTTHRGKRAAPAEDLVKRDFRATAKDKIWVADITYVATSRKVSYTWPSSSMPTPAGSSDGPWRIISGQRSSWTLSGWPSAEGSPLPVWCIIPTKGCNTLRSLSPKD